MIGISVQKFFAFLGGQSEGLRPILGYASDSRKVVVGGLFFALGGQRCDGHQFLQEVANRGVIAAVVSKEYRGEDYGLQLLKADSVINAMGLLAQSLLQEKKRSVIGVTGSLGKTTTKEFIATLLEGKYKVGRSPGNFNTNIGLPLSIFNLKGDEEVLVLEMGMNHAGEIERLLEIAPVDLAVITKVSLVHTMFFKEGLEGIAKAKAEILGSERTKTAILDHELLQYDCFKDWKGRKYSFSVEKQQADYFLSSLEEEFFIDEEGVRSSIFDLPFQELHFQHDFLAAVAVARMMKMSFKEIVLRIPFLQIPKMRFQKWEKNGSVLINDAYNASPDAMKAALRHLPAPKPGGKRIAVLGSMKELGDFSESAHREVGQFALSHVDCMLCLGEECAPIQEVFSNAKKPVELFVSQTQLIEKLKDCLREGDVVLIKGSRSLEMEKILDNL